AERRQLQSALSPYERIGPRLVAELRGRAVAGDDERIEIARVEALPDRLRDLLGVAAGEVGAADRAAEERVAGEHEVAGLRIVDREADRAGRVAGRMDHVELALAHLYDVAVLDPALDRGRRPHAPAEHRGLRREA